MSTQNTFLRRQAVAVANSKTRSRLYSLAGAFAYGKNLSKEALNQTFREPDTKRWKKSLDSGPAEPLLALFNECSGWSRLDWLSKDNWKRVRNVLSEVLFPRKFRKYRENFKLRGIRAGKLCEETIEFVKVVSRSWKSAKSRSTSTKLEIQNSIDLLEMMIQESLVEASLRKECIQQLIRLCRKHHHMPKALELTRLIFDRDASTNIFDFGGSSDIMLAELDGQKVVVKVLRADKAIQAGMRKREWSSLHEEALNWIGLDFPGLNPFLGITLKHPRGNLGIGLVFKFQELGNSVRYLHEHPIDRVDFVQAKAFYLIGTIHYLHQMDLVHADIKGANILVDANKNLVLTDFGLMLRTLLQSPSTTPLSVTTFSSMSGAMSADGDCTLRFSSKERILNQEKSNKDDIWAIGMTLIELLTGKPPFSEKYKNDLWFFNALTQSELDIQKACLPESVPIELLDVIKRCISPCPEDRPTTFELYSIMGRIAGSRALKGVMKEGYS